MSGPSIGCPSATRRSAAAFSAAARSRGAASWTTRGRQGSTVESVMLASVALKEYVVDVRRLHVFRQPFSPLEGSTVTDELDAQLESVGVLAEPARRALYRYVVGQPGPVSREQAADAVGLPRHTVKFHLERLVDGGLLDVEFRRLTGRSGPGAGRPAKLYRRADREVSVTLPERRYDVVGDVLADAVDRTLTGEVPLEDALRDAAQDCGRGLARDFLERHPETAGSAAPAAARTAAVLAEEGYEPRTT